MSRKIIIDKYRGNTHYNVHVIDSFGQEHHLGYLGITFHTFTEIDVLAEEIWQNEVKNEPSSMDKAISACIELEKENGLRFTDSRGNHRDGLD